MTDLARLMRPRSVAVVGGGWGVAVIEQLRKMGFAGELWAVHPNRDEIAGIPAVPRIEDLPAPPDAAYIAVNRRASIDAVSALSSLGAGGAVCFASGFAEAEDDRAAGAALQADLIAAAGQMPILGPNCYGLINYLDRVPLWPDQHGGVPVERGVAILGQSSNVLINLTMQQRALPLAYVAAAGNQAMTGLADMALALMEDPRITAIGLHIEGISDIQAFEAMAARARERRIPIVALKVGRSTQARAATVSHTASMTGGDAAGRAFLARQNVPVLDSIPAFLETLKLLHVFGPLPGRRLSSMSCSGGEAALIADTAEAHDIILPPLGEADRARIKATLSDLVTVANPLDYHTFIWNDQDRLTATYEAMLKSGFDLNLLVLDFPRADRCSDDTWMPCLAAIQTAATTTGARVAVSASMPENMPESRARDFVAAGIVPMMGLGETLAAAAAAADIHAGWERPAPLPVLAVPAPAHARPLHEADAKARLGQYSVPVPALMIAATPEEAAAAAQHLGFPVALKALGLAHKSDAGGVKLGLDSAERVVEEAGWMPGAQGFLVECMVSGGIAEMLIGVVRDPVHGYALTLGAGGVLAELLADSQTLLIPSTEAEIAQAIERLRMAPLLHGYRGGPAASIPRIVEAVMAVQAFAMNHAGLLSEVEINPLIITPATAVAADALMQLDLGDHGEDCCGH